MVDTIVGYLQSDWTVLFSAVPTTCACLPRLLTRRSGPETSYTIKYSGFQLYSKVPWREY